LALGILGWMKFRGYHMRRTRYGVRAAMATNEVRR
jgi:hypothetical protein